MFSKSSPIRQKSCEQKWQTTRCREEIGISWFSPNFHSSFHWFPLPFPTNHHLNIHSQVHSISFQEEEEKGEDEEEKREQNWKYGNREENILQMDVIHYLPSVVRLQNANKVITCRFLVQPTLSVHCHKISFCLVYVPVHVFPLPMYPVLQVQLYEPILLLHCAFTWQKGGETVHSSTSGKITTKN